MAAPPPDTPGGPPVPRRDTQLGHATATAAELDPSQARPSPGSESSSACWVSPTLRTQPKPSPAPQTVPLPWTALKGPVPVTEVSQPRPSALTWRNPGLSLISPGNGACSAPCVPVQVPAARGAGAPQLEFAQECRAKSPGRCTVRARSAAGASWGQAEGLLQCVRTASWTGTAPARPGLPPENPVRSAAADTDPHRGWESTQASLSTGQAGRHPPPRPLSPSLG